jgi:hypothetical protein
MIVERGAYAFRPGAGSGWMSNQMIMNPAPLSPAVVMERA